MLIVLTPEEAAAIYVTRAKDAMGNGNNGVWTGTVFEPSSNASPASLLPAGRGNYSPYERFCNPDIETMMIYTDGACASNGQAAPRGGFAFSTPLPEASASARWSRRAYTHTNNRAELRAAIAALTFRSWDGEGWKKVVIVTDSTYTGWCTSDGTPVANRDLWEALSEAMGHRAGGGCEISFWIVPREWNTLADAAAKEGSRLESPRDYQEIYGVAC
ncbi:ribonuclease H-like domain-containing protein [Mycena capillaripes]|nr:ribonuclease H-like domain-containing protein [Mycena capillaripes]